MRAGARLFLLVVSCLLLLATTPDNEQPLGGYSAASSRSERDWEGKFRAIPEPQNQRDYMQRLDRPSAPCRIALRQGQCRVDARQI